jgi:AraC family transcriptional regulator, ethanolamine operon transcriptional activator
MNGKRMLNQGIFRVIHSNGFYCHVYSIHPTEHIKVMSTHHTVYRDQPLFDAYEQQVAQDWLPIEIMQLSAGQYRGHYREMGNDDVRIVLEQQNQIVHKRAIIEQDFCTVSFARSANNQVRVSEYDGFENSLFFLPANVEVDIQAGVDVETIYFRFEQSALLESARAINPQHWEMAAECVMLFSEVNRQPLEVFTDYLCELSAMDSNHLLREQQKNMNSSVMEYVLLALDSSLLLDGQASDVLSRRRATISVRQAINYIHAKLESHTCPTILDICKDLYISQRNLQYNFKKVVGVTPNAYLYRLRLNRVRSQLLCPVDISVTVTQVASEWHFWHLGRFSNDYLQLFGELPSTTLRRAFN